jgi:hypothetical protein
MKRYVVSGVLAGTVYKHDNAPVKPPVAEFRCTSTDFAVLLALPNWKTASSVWPFLVLKVRFDVIPPQLDVFVR